MTLSNGIECVVVSNTDANTRKVSTAAVTVEAGSYLDPPEAEGLAHFLEHMVMLKR